MVARLRRDTLHSNVCVSFKVNHPVDQRHGWRQKSFPMRQSLRREIPLGRYQIAPHDLAVVFIGAILPYSTGRREGSEFAYASPLSVSLSLYSCCSKKENPPAGGKQGQWTYSYLARMRNGSPPVSVRAGTKEQYPAEELADGQTDNRA